MLSAGQPDRAILHTGTVTPEFSSFPSLPLSLSFFKQHWRRSTCPCFASFLLFTFLRSYVGIHCSILI